LFYLVDNTHLIGYYLTLLIPLSFKGEGEEWFVKGLRPFKLPLIICYLALPLKENGRVSYGDVLPPSNFP